MKYSQLQVTIAKSFCNMITFTERSFSKRVAILYFEGRLIKKHRLNFEFTDLEYHEYNFRAPKTIHDPESRWFKVWVQVRLYGILAAILILGQVLQLSLVVVL